MAVAIGSAPKHGARPSPRAPGLDKKMAAPARALFERLVAGSDSSQWADFLPASVRLRKADASPATCTTTSSRSAASASASPSSFFQRVEGRADAMPGKSDMRPALEEIGDRFGDSASAQILGRVVELSQDPVGCRQVQRALDLVEEGGDACEALVAELRGHVLEVSRCPYGNFVGQKCIAVSSPEAVQFVIDEILAGGADEFARHKYGCRILQRLFERCTDDQIHDLIDLVARDSASLSLHPYGNYVVQNALRHGSAKARREITHALAGDIRAIGAEASGCAVLGTALGIAAVEDARCLARAIMDEPGMLVFMAGTRYGHSATLRCLEVLEGEDREEMRRRLSDEAASLRSSCYGRTIADAVESDSTNSQLIASMAGA